MLSISSQELVIVRRREVERATGFCRSTIYHHISRGLWPKPVPLGARAVGWPAREVTAMNAARIAGWGEDKIRRLVTQLEGERSKLMPTRWEDVMPANTAIHSVGLQEVAERS